MSYANTSLLLPMNGANNGVVFQDYSPVRKTVNPSGTAKTVTTDSKYYGSSLELDGSANCVLSVPQNAALNLGSSDYTIELWTRPLTIPATDTTQAAVLSKWESTGNNREWILLLRRESGTNIVRFAVSSDGSTSTNFFNYVHSMNTSNWYHLAVVRDGSTLRLFIDGTQVSTATAINVFNGVNSMLVGGIQPSATTILYNGRINDVRVTKGSALYTASFTPPARLLGTISNSAVGAAKILDINGDPAERTVFAVPRSAPTRVWSDVSDVNGEFEIQVPAGVDHSVVALADETGLRNDIVHRVIPV